MGQRGVLAGRQDRDSRLPEHCKFAANNQQRRRAIGSLPMVAWDIPNKLSGFDCVDQAGGSRGRHYTMRMPWRHEMNNVEGLGCQTNVPNDWVDQSRGRVNASSMLNGGRTGDVSHGTWWCGGEY